MAETDNPTHQDPFLQVLTLGMRDIGNDEMLAFISSHICGGKTFEILVTEDPPPGYDRESAEVDWTFQLLDLSMHDGTDQDKLQAQDSFMHRIDNDIKKIALSKMLEIAPPSPGSPPPTNPLRGIHTVQEHLYPNVVKLQLVSRGGQFELIDGHRMQLNELNPTTYSELEDLGFEAISTVPTFPASNILLLSQCNDGMGVYYASDLGRTENFVCKLLSDWSRKAFVKELVTYGKIRKAKRSAGLKTRVSTLKALVTHNGGICGMLIERIPSRFPSFLDVVNAKVPVPLVLKKKWAAQIEESVMELHKHGIIWGDAKPGNIIIDDHDDAWLIDFNGGYTVGWIEQGLVDTVGGDLEAVRKMRERLEGE